MGGVAILQVNSKWNKNENPTKTEIHLPQFVWVDDVDRSIEIDIGP